MAVWHETLNLRDVFHNDDMEFEVKRDEIVKRITSLRLLDATAEQIAEALGDAEDEDEFDEYWSEFYDWADSVRVWVATF